MKKLKQFLTRNKSNPHLYAALVWILLIIPTVLWWKESILWVAIMSLYANIENSFAAMEAKNG